MHFEFDIVGEAIVTSFHKKLAKRSVTLRPEIFEIVTPILKDVVHIHGSETVCPLLNSFTFLQSKEFIFKKCGKGLTTGSFYEDK